MSGKSNAEVMSLWPRPFSPGDDACDRAMDRLIEIHEDLEREVFWQVATLLDLEVDLLFFDTTSTYFERDTPDEPVGRDGWGLLLPSWSAGWSCWARC